MKLLKLILPVTLGLALPFSALATEIQIRTSLGTINVNLFDETTPETVDNFLMYINSGTYANSIVHRSIEDFVIQGGGYSLDIPPQRIATNPPILNEPVLSNVRGTIAMAKAPSDPNSATSQWFINIADSSSNLDVQNGGFTVFGQVVGDGMDVVDAIAALQTFNLGSDFEDLPLVDYTIEDADNGVEVGTENVITVEDIVIIDAAVVTRPELTPVPNTLIDQVPDSGNEGGEQSDSGGSGGGAMNMLWLLLLVPITLMRSRIRTI